MTWFHFRLMKTVCFFVADHVLVGQLCTNPKSDRSLLSCLKVTQCSTRETGDAPRYNSCSLPIHVMTTEPLPAPSKCKSVRFNAWGHSSTYRTNFGGDGAERHCQEDPDQGIHRKGPGNHWWNSPAAYSANCQRFRRSHTQLWMHVWRRTWSVGPTGARQARSWLKRQRTSG